MRVFGTIEDAYTEKLLPGAVITLGVGDTELIENTPSKDGHFDYNIPDAAIPIDIDTLTCTVKKRGYKTLASTYMIPDGDIELALELTPNPIHWRRIFMTAGLILAGLLLILLITFGVKYFFFGPPPYPIKTFTVTPNRIDAGGTAEITWVTLKAYKVFLDQEEVTAKGTKTVTPPQTRRYRLEVKDKTGKSTAREYIQLKVTPSPPVIASFTVTPLEIYPWESAVLEWKTTGAETLYIRSEPDNNIYPIDIKKIQKERTLIDEDYPDKTGKDPKEKETGLNGSVEVSPLETVKFTLVAVNSEGVKSEETVELNVLTPPRVIGFNAAVCLIDPGESVLLDWNVQDAEQVLLNNERVAPRYSVEVRPMDTTTYKLTARNKAGERQSAITIEVRCPSAESPTPAITPPRIHRFHISAPEIAPGESTVITWVTDNAEKVYLITGGDQPLETDPKIPLEIIAGLPLETGTVVRVKPVDTLRVSPQVTTRYELRVINPLKQLSWTRSVAVKTVPCTIELYEYENYTGESMRFTTDATDVGNMNNRVSSIKITGNCGVRVYSAPGFKASYQEFHQGIPSLRGTWIGNNTISSLKIIPFGGGEK